MSKQAWVLAIGDELLSGETVDTNSNYLDRLLEGHGWTVARHLTVPDDLDAIATAFSEAAQSSDLVLSTGGLGPTRDDLTLAGLAQALGCKLVRDEAVIASIKARFASFGREMTPNNERQAMVPELGETLVNEAGTAPGFLGTLTKAQVFLMPGVPREVRWLMKHQILPRIPEGDTPRLRRTLKVIGLGESRLEHSIRQLVRAHPQVKFGFRTMGLENHIKLLSQGPDRQTHLEAAETELRDLLGIKIYGADEDDLSTTLGVMLAEREVTVAVAESCTAGAVAKLLTDPSGSSRYFLGGVLSYHNDVKVGQLGVSQGDLQAHGAVSEPVCRQMAEGVRERIGSDYGLSTTGVAGPTGGSDEKPVGTVWLGLAGPNGTEAHKIRFPGDREWVRTGSAKAVLDLLRRHLLNPPNHDR